MANAILAIDPGADQGWAIFSPAGDLTGCGLGEPKFAGDFGPHRVVCERPAIYPHGRQRARPCDIITLALRAGEAAGVFARRFGVAVEYYEPAEWKGGAVSKQAHHPRIWARLTEREQRIVSKCVANIPVRLHHNVLDAIGIGLHAIARNA